MFIRTIRTIILLLAGVAALDALHKFSRFTVDDAFITWRYGRNLVESGIWNFNPSILDPTQAYTNPVYALLGIVPHLFGWDVVLFFKIVSIILLAAFIFWFSRVTRGSLLMTLAFVAMPATVVHAFGGLETFLYVFLTGALLISLYEHRMWQAVGLSLALFLTRPESWLLVAMVPAYFALVPPSQSRPTFPARPSRQDWQVGLSPSRGALSLLALAIPLAAYFAFHYFHFGSALPNTFYAKSGVEFDAGRFTDFLPLLLPAALLAWFGRPWLAMLALAFLGAISVKYSLSDLQMNYSGRFAFHIFAPVYILLVYLASRIEGSVLIPRQEHLKQDLHIPWRNIAAAVPLTLLAMFASEYDSTSNYAATYYARCLNAHTELGKTLARIHDKYQLRTLAIGDAGMAPYHSGMNVLDIVGLGSSAVARHGMSPELLDSAGVDVVAFFATPAGIRTDWFNQPLILDWAQARGFQPICDLYAQKDYTLRLYARQPIPELLPVCEHSRRMNDLTDKEMRNSWQSPPWTYWRE